MNAPSSVAVPPDFLTVEEAARVVRIGRTKAYDLARLFLATNGADGLPVMRFGKQLRVPRCRLEACLGGPITWPPATDDTAVERALANAIRARVIAANDAHDIDADPAVQPARSSRTRRSAGDQAPRLFSV